MIKNYDVVIDPVKTYEQGISSFTNTAEVMCRAIQNDICRLGIFICGTGLGFCTVANTYWGIRAAHASETYTTQRAKKSLNAQILCLGCRILAEGITQAAKEDGNKILIVDAEQKAAIHIQIVEDFIAQKVAAVFLNPVDRDAIEPALRAIAEAKIPVINFDAGVANMDIITAFVATNNYQVGLDAYAAVAGKDIKIYGVDG